ncbi:MAG: DNA primase [Lachnospiraceae bacterium]|nr:DNA primase [Lachnospiraceae bacterium]
MPRYSEKVIQEIMDKSDIVDVIGRYIKIERQGSDYKCLCPFHNDRNPSMHVSRTKQLYHCFSCGAGGNVITFLENYENFTYIEAIKELADMYNVKLEEEELSPERKKENDRRAKLFEIQKDAATYFYLKLRSPGGEKAYQYFKARGLSDETMKKFGLGFSEYKSDDLYKYLKQKGYDDKLLIDSGLIKFDEKRGCHDAFWNRAMFPIMDVRSKVIAFGGRVMGDGEPKYLNSPETSIFHKSKNLYALNIARSSKRKGMVLCEGYMDVISLHQAGFDNAVAALGTAFTDNHALVLKKYVSDIYVCFDSDGAGVKAAVRAIPILKKAGLTARVINLEPYKDPDEFIKGLGANAFEERIKAAENAFTFLIKALQSSYDMSDPEDRSKFQREVGNRIAAIENDIERENYLTDTAVRFSIGIEALRSEVDKILRAGGPAPETAEKKSGITKKKALDAPEISAQRILLSYLSEHPEEFKNIKTEITPEDFTDELYKEMAVLMYEMLENGRLSPSEVTAHFTDEELSRRAANVFYEKLPDEQSNDKAMNQVIHTIKLSAISQKADQAKTNDLNAVQDYINKMASMKKK